MHSDYRLIREIKKKNDRNSANELVSRFMTKFMFMLINNFRKKS